MNTLLRKSATTIVALALILGAWVATAQSSAEAAVRQTLGWGYAAGAAAAEFDGTRHHGLYNSTHTDVTGSAALSEGTVQVSFTPATGRGACRSYAWATIDVATGSGFAQRSDWMFNNIVMFASR